MNLADVFPKARGQTYVLVHGAWVGEFCFEPIIPHFKEANVRSALFRGEGKRRAENRSSLKLQDYIDDVIALIVGNDLTDIHLVGHSYGGKVITGARDQLRERTAHVFFRWINPRLC